MANEALERLRDHLQQEREVLLNGRISELADISTRRAELIELLEALEPCDAIDLSELGLQARRNQRLLDASLSGIKTARKRLEDVRRAATQLDTYTLGGERKNLIGPNGRVERRA